MLFSTEYVACGRVPPFPVVDSSGVLNSHPAHQPLLAPSLEQDWHQEKKLHLSVSSQRCSHSLRVNPDPAIRVRGFAVCSVPLPGHFLFDATSDRPVAADVPLQMLFMPAIGQMQELPGGESAMYMLNKPESRSHCLPSSTCSELLLASTLDMQSS